MAYMKKTTAKKTEVKKDPVVKKPVTKKSKSKLYIATKTRMYHPHQEIYLFPGAKGTQLKLDSWLKAQIKRGLVKEV